GDLKSPEHTAYALDVGHQRDSRNRAAGRPVADASGVGVPRALLARYRDHLRDDQRDGWVLCHRPNAGDVQAQGAARGGSGGRARGVDRRRRQTVIVTGVFLQSSNFINALYIVAFSMFIYGMSGLTGPRTAVRGNKIAAGGMVVAVVATLLTK